MKDSASADSSIGQSSLRTSESRAISRDRDERSGP